MAVMPSTYQDRIRGAAFAAVAVAAIGYALVAGLAVHFVTRIGDDLKLFAVAPPPPPPVRTVPEPKKSHKAAGAAAPPNLKAKPAEIVAPPPIIRLTVPPPVIVAPKAGTGTALSAGAALAKGPGTGAGGQGDGTGSGGAGDGEGDGETPLRWIKGSIRDSDYPMAALKAGIGGTVSLRFTVGVKGRVTACTVTHSSGSALLDQTTCRLIMERFRYEPTRDAQGRAIPDEVTGEHVWTALGPPPEEDER